MHGLFKLNQETTKEKSEFNETRRLKGVQKNVHGSLAQEIIGISKQFRK